MDVVVKTEPPDDGYCQVAAVPEDSQWQKKRSKLHNLLFGSHGSLSPRVGTPEPAVEQTESHNESQGTSHGSDDNNSYDDTLTEAAPVVVKVENVEEGENLNYSLQSDSIQSLYQSNLEVAPSSSHNGSLEEGIALEQDSRSSLLKSMLTCPMSKMKSPGFEEYQQVLNDSLQRKQKDSSEIRKMLSKPLKSDSLSSSAVPSLSESLNSSPLLQNTLLSSTPSPQLSSSASALLKQLGALSNSNTAKTPPSYLGLELSQQTSHETYLQNTAFSVSETNTPKSFKEKNRPNVNNKRSKEISENADENNSHSKAKAIEDAVGNFSQFLRKSMSKHDFSADQMKFIMESALKSASKVISDTAKRSNVSENLKATATNFIENAIGNVIRNETLKKQTKKSAKKSKKHINAPVNESEPLINTDDTSNNSPAITTEKLHNERKRPKVDDNSSITKTIPKRLLNTNESIGFETFGRDYELPFFEDQLVFGKNAVGKRTIYSSSKECEKRPSKRPKYDRKRLKQSENQTALQTKSVSDHNENQSQEPVCIKQEPEDNEYEKESCSGTNELETDNLMEDVKAEVDGLKQMNMSHDVITESCSTTGKETVHSESCVTDDRGTHHADDECQNQDQSNEIASDATHQESIQDNLETNTIPVDHSIVKIEPDFVNDDPVMTSEMKDISTCTKSESKTNKEDSPRMDFLQEEIEKSLKEPTVNVDIAVQLNNAVDKSMIPTSYKCETCGQEFEHKGTLKVHQRGHNFKNKTFQCSICGKCVTDSSYLKIHMRTHQSESEFITPATPSFECDVCHLQFSNFGNYQLHRRMHKGEKLFKCDDCGTGFTRKSQLSVHGLIHTGERPFKCEICGMTFRQNSGLKLHVLVHTDDKPQKCPFCSASFARKAHLDKHIRYHSGERPFVCYVCNKAFIGKELLKQHLKTVHPDGKPGKRGIYKPRYFVDQVTNRLGPNWKGFVALKEDSEDSTVPLPCFPCGVCGETYDQIPLLVEHLETHTQNKPVSDTSGTRSGTDDLDTVMVNDMVSSQSETPGQEVDSLYSSSGAGHYPLGIKIEKMFRCPFCEETFDMPGMRIKHIHESHPVKNSDAGVTGNIDSSYQVYRQLLGEEVVDKLYRSDSETTGVTETPVATSTDIQSLKLGSNLSTDTLTDKQSIKPSDLNRDSPTDTLSMKSPNVYTDTPKLVPEQSTNISVVKVESEAKEAELSIPRKEEAKTLQCPYCTRVYQRQSSRTRHINENHREMKDTYRLLQEMKERQKIQNMVFTNVNYRNHGSEDQLS